MTSSAYLRMAPLAVIATLGLAVSLLIACGPERNDRAGGAESHLEGNGGTAAYGGSSGYSGSSGNGGNDWGGYGSSGYGPPPDDSWGFGSTTSSSGY
jgi:hypothetical protein